MAKQNQNTDDHTSAESVRFWFKIFLSILSIASLIVATRILYFLIAFRKEIFTNQVITEEIVDGIKVIGILMLIVAGFYYLVFIKRVKFKKGDGVPPA